MQRCPYLAEMKERFWRSNNNGNETKKLTDDESDELLKSVAMTTKTSKQSTIARLAQPEPDDPDETMPMLQPSVAIGTSTTVGHPTGPPATPATSASIAPPQQSLPSQTGVSTVVKVKLDGTGSRTVTERPPSFIWIQQPVGVQKWCCSYGYKFPKNAKTSLFIISSALYCKLAVLVCLTALLAEVVTIHVPLYLFEGIFTYLYSGSILFFLYVFCYLLHDTSQKKRQKSRDKEPKKDEEGAGGDPADSKQSGERKQSFLQESRTKAKYELAERERLDPLLSTNESMLKGVRKGSDAKDVNLNDGSDGAGGGQPPAAAQSVHQHHNAQEKGVIEGHGGVKEGPKPKTSQSDTAHGSFFLRMGTLAFGLGSMIYIGLELGSFFEIPFDSACHNILRGVNPLLQLIFTFMQMYFIFINSRLRIHKFKIIARFGLMHVVATNLCVWIRILVRECLKEITTYQGKGGHGVSEGYMIIAGKKSLYGRLGWDQSGTTAPPPFTFGQQQNSGGGRYEMDQYLSPPNSVVAPTKLPNETQYNITCERVPPFMGNVVPESAPYLFPVVIEYSLIAAAVAFIIWRNIGRGVPTKGSSEEGDESQQECWEMGTETYSRYTGGGGDGPGSTSGPVDCVGASKGLFLGLLLLVAALICLILFFVLVTREQVKLKLLAICLADGSHAVLLVISLLATFIGFIRVRRLRFHGDHGSPLRDILLRVSILGVFAYALFSLIAGTIVGLNLDIPPLLVGGTAILVLLQVIIQMLFISDVGRRRIHMPEHSRTKPGRQIVTLLLITNLTMWAVMILEIRKVESDPIQLDFFGVIPWLLIQRFALPLYIFHRFFSAVTLAEIWKNTYTIKYLPVATGP